MVGYWADFINPFSGQPYLNSRKGDSLYETDERFRCLGFKVEEKNNCRIIAHDSNLKNFIGMYILRHIQTQIYKYMRQIDNDSQCMK